MNVREMQTPDIDRILDYWMDATPAFLQGMGVDLEKVPSRSEWSAMLVRQLTQSYAEKENYCLIWELDGQPVGHSNVNNIVCGLEAHMHLHLWRPDLRRKGAGVSLVRLSLPYYFHNLQLQTLYCQPSALNPAPNRTLAKAGFTFERAYVTIPSMICFEQRVNRWAMTRGAFERMSNAPGEEV
ncbi:GNAT family N-acetyltransferase [Chitinophaga lutea]